MLLCASLFIYVVCLFVFFCCNIEFFFHTVGVFILWLNTCSNSWTQLPQTRSLCWVIFGWEVKGSSKEECFILSGVEIGFILWTVAVWFRSPSPHHSHRAVKADAVMLWHPFGKAELNHSWYPKREEHFVSYASCYVFFFFFTEALVCVVLGGRGVEQTQNRLSSSAVPL